MIPRAEFTGLILAGGLARRMQGTGLRVPSGQTNQHSAMPGFSAEREKGLALLRGEPLVAHACRALAPQVDRVLISANRHTEQYSRYGQVISDDPGLGTDLGPLAGVAQGLATITSAWLAVMPVDVLGIPADMVARLSDGATRHGAHAAYAVSLVGQSARAHPLCMIVHRSMAADLQAFLQAGDRKVFMWMSRISAVPVHFEDNDQAFANINTLDDLEKANRLCSR
ncbi:molybdenum cofactor guanylyltransferase MobA [Allopusillimonas ginsengisoli]|uniref:molybdenum cofactor guanylyltransferase MobA n=1 Tax=Allopusillimonas ginsengisoli TaxID=453575 RepID=UPI001021C3FA|nr:molybdenum cofactor guanylyltransferase MobA [Allopusillimonas ginsengisoli]TEA77494.1 molybdenum cofactor guanylyltransferase [Allopusillimonas ginsengisoli]